MSRPGARRIAVVRDTLLEGLKAVERFPKVAKKHRQFSFWMEGDEMVLGNGLTTYRIAATGYWPDAAVLPAQALAVLRSLIESADASRPVMLEAIAGAVAVDRARIPCVYRALEQSVADSLEAERLRQRAVDPDPEAKPGERRPGTRRDILLAQIRDLRPDFEIIPPYDQCVAAFRDVPRLIVRVTSLWLEFHFLDDAAQDKSTWLKHSTLWKKVNFDSLSDLGLKELLDYAVHAAGKAPPTP